ncbi:hypothetical protein V1478_004262 [Vespula squamosa]|uniref:Uncharacterized protein n=1 Tax=Vespula squamosa TaxID=30214 RepID=A0ABD2BIG0_VESSQ
MLPADELEDLEDSCKSNRMVEEQEDQILFHQIRGIPKSHVSSMNCYEKLKMIKFTVLDDNNRQLAKLNA